MSPALSVGRLSALALAPLSLASKEPDTDSYYSYSDTDSYYSYSAVEDACSPGCGRSFRDDGECDATCNNVCSVTLMEPTVSLTLESATLQRMGQIIGELSLKQLIISLASSGVNNTPANSH